jgi:hypothetical protein
MRKHFLILMLLTLLPFAAWAHDVSWTSGAAPTFAYTGSAYGVGDLTSLMTVISSYEDHTCSYNAQNTNYPSGDVNQYNVTIHSSQAAAEAGTGALATVTAEGTYYLRVSVRAQTGVSGWFSTPTYGNDRQYLSFKIKAKTNVEVSFFKYTKTYGQDDPEAKNLPESAHNTPSGATWDDIKGYLKLERVDAGEHVGNYHYTIKQDGGEDVYNILINVVAATIDIQQANATITAENKSKTYGDEDPEFTATATGLINNGVVQDDLTNIGLSFTRADGETVAGGPYAITPASTSLDYNFTYVNGALTINQRPLTLKAAAASKTYGAVEPELTLVPVEEQVQNFAPGEDASTIGLEITRAAGETVPGSPYTITPAATIAAAAANYAITVNTAEFTINKAPLNVTVANKEKTYGVADPAFELVPADASQFKFTDDISVVTPNFSRVAGETVAAGPYEISAVPTADNYDVTVDATGLLTINKKAATVNAVDNNKEYGEDDPTLTATATGLVVNPGLGINDNVSNVGLVITRAAGETVAAGPYEITVTSDNGNYEFTFNPAEFTINPAPATITAENKSKTYGEGDPEFTATATGLKNNALVQDNLTNIGLSLSRVEGETVAASPYTITPVATSTNYTFSYVDGALTIGQRDLELTAVNKSKVYGQPDPLFETTVTAGSYKEGETFATIGGSFIREKLGLDEGELVGHYYIQPVAAAAGNYNINFVNGDLEITKATATLTAENKSKTYGEADPEFTVVAEGLTNKDDLTTIGAGATRAAGEDAAEYAISPKGNAHFEDNYTFTYVDGTMTINPKAITVTAEDKNKVYGDADPEFTAVADGLEFTDQVADLGLTITRAEGENVGHYAITPSAGTNTNYTYTYNDGDFEITKKNATLTAVPKLKVYGEEDPEFTATCEQLTNGDDMTTIGLSFTRMPGENVGFYAITPNATSLNYNWTFVPDNLEITPAYLVLTADNASKTYGAADPEFALAEIPNYKNGDDATSIGLTITRTNAAVEAAGTYEDVIVPAATSLNYEYEINAADFTIGKKAATLTAENKSKVYGNAEPTYTVVAEGLAGDDNLSTIGWSTSRAEGEHFGTYAITPAATSENYEWTFEDGTLTIEKRGLLYALSNKEVEYNGKAVTTEGVYTLSSGSFADGESLAGLGISFDFFDEIKNAGTYTADKLNVDYNENIDYDINFTGNATIKVNQKPFTEEMIKNFAASKKYTGFAQNPGYTVEDKPEAENIIAESDYTVAIAKAGAEVTKDEVVEAGTYTYTFAPVAEGNYKGEAIAKNFAIGGMDFTDALLEAWVDETTYNAEAQPAEYTLSYENLESEVVTLNEGTDFTVAITVGEDAATEVKNADVYTYTFTGVGNYAGNFTKTYTINKAEIDPEGITAPVAVEGLVYSAADQTLIAAGAATTQFGEVLPVLYNLAGGEFAEELPQAKNAGNYEVNFKVDGGQNYIDVVAGPVANVKIAKAPVVVTAESVERTYNGVAGLHTEEPELIFSGFKGEDTKDVVAGIAPVSVENANKNVGVYNLIVNTENLSADNYSFAAAEIQGTLTINKADLTFTFNDRDEEDAYLIKKEYGKDDPDFKAFVAIDGNIESEASFLNNILVNRVKTDEAVGTYDDAIAISLKTTTAAKNLFANYNVTNEDKGDFEITKAALTIALKADEGKVYDAETVNSVEVTYDKLVVTSLAAGDDIQTAITTLPTATIDNAKNVGTYAITLDGAVAPNYEISYIDARYVITAAPLSEFNVQTQVIRVGDDKDAINSALWQVTGIQGDEDKDAIFQLVVDPSLYDEDGKINAAAGEYISGLVLEVIDADAAANYSGFENVEGNLTVVDETGGTAIVLYDDQEQFDNLVTADGTTLDVTVVVGRNQAIGKYDGKWHADEWNTMVLPFDVTPKELSNAFGYAIVNLVDPSRTTEGNVAFKLNLTQTIPANTPFTIRTDEDIEGGILFENKTIVAPTSAQVSVDAGCGYSFVGVYNTFTIDNTHPNYHFLVNGGWKHIGASSSNTYDIVPFNCYVDQSATSSVRPEDVTFTFEDENGVTAIKTVNVDAEGMFAEGWFTLDGKKLNAAPAQKGVYIHNGKKTVIK